MNRAKTAAIVEARIGSTRFRGKVLADLLGRSMLERVLERLQQARKLTDIIIATTHLPEDDAIVEVSQRAGFPWFRGSVEDVLERDLGAAKSVGADIIVQMGADSPLLDPEIVDECISTYGAGDYDYVSNALTLTYPLGINAQVFSTALLEKTSGLTSDPVDREDVSRYIWERPDVFRLKNLAAPSELHAPHIRLTVDHPEDLELVRRIYLELYPTKPTFRTRHVLALLRQNPDWLALNTHCVQRSAPHLPRQHP